MNEVVTLDRPVLVAGCGSIGSRHLRNLVSLGVGPLLTYDPDSSRSLRAAQAVSGTPLEALEDMPELGAAFVCTPTSRHLAVAHAALDRGAHLFIEKPLAASLDGVPELLDKARRLRRIVMVGFNLRFHPCLQRIKGLVDDGSIGRPLGARVEFGQYLPDWHPWEDYRQGYSASRALGGGIVLDATHEFDYARWILGEVQAVTGMTGASGSLEIDTEDCATFVMQHAGGAFSELHLDYLQRVYARTCKVIGSEGTVYWDWHAHAVRCFRAGRGTWEEFPEPKGYEVNTTYVEEARTFLQAAQGDGEPSVDGETGARVLEVALAAKVAAAERRTVTL